LKASSLKVFFTIGFLISFSFLSKQYGLFFVAPLCIDLFFIQKQHRIKRLLALGVGFMVPVFIFLVYLYTHGASVKQGIGYMLGKGVPIDVGNGTGNSYDFFSYSIGIVIFLFVRLMLRCYPIITANSLIGLIKSVLSLQFWVDKSDTCQAKFKLLHKYALYFLNEQKR
jgi:hypothetical protein